MMICFYDTGALLQTILLIVSQFTVIVLTGGVVLVFKQRCRLCKGISLCMLLLLNIALYVVMQLGSRSTGVKHGLHLHISYVVLTLITLLSLAYTVWAILGETGNRRTLNHTSIKESFDNLPTGVCFFNEAGLPVLCNFAMHRFGFSVCGKDVQFITDLESCLAGDFMPIEGVRKDGLVFVLKDGRAWHLEKRIFPHESGNIYTQYIARDVTDLHKNRVELIQENEQLRKVQKDLQRLSANVVTITREEEILNAKMRIHDEMGRCLVAAQKYLEEDSIEGTLDSVAASWQRAVSMLKYNNDTPEEDILLQIRKSCEFMKISFIKTGELPKEGDIAYILTCAVRECVTNAVRYAGATELYADFTETENEAAVIVTNSGKVPESKITEGGGLSTLRRRVERVGGTMIVQSHPYFKLAVTIPKGKEKIL